jgi:hypothetical protein
MRNFSFIGLLLTVAIIGWMAKGYLAPAVPVSHDPNDKTTVEYWIAHPTDRATMLAYCNAHPQEQNTGECQLATSAQTTVDTGGPGSQANQPAPANNGVEQGSGQASDELQAQQDSNTLDPGGQ